jgi:hypothetical protein
MEPTERKAQPHYGMGREALADGEKPGSIQALRSIPRVATALVQRGARS